MTKEEFLKFRNPKEKYHPSSSYNFSILDLNHDYPKWTGEVYLSQNTKIKVHELSSGFCGYNQDGKLVFIIYNGTLYYEHPSWIRNFSYSARNWRDEEKKFNIQATKQVKYLSELLTLVSPIARKNETEFPIILQQIIINGEPLTIRTEEKSKIKNTPSIVILNSSGLLVAQASDEFGATLIAVTQEYRGHGLGKILGKIWYAKNPTYESGGFTAAGEANAIAIWKERVKEFLEFGWYSELVRAGKISKNKVDAILSGIGPKKEKNSFTEEKVSPTGNILIYLDDPIFIIYDAAFLTEQDEKFIHGFGFFRASENVGSYIFRIEYDSPFADLTTRVALQLARDKKEKIYDGEGYHDFVEWEGMPGVKKDGNYIITSQDLIPLQSLAQKEKILRRKIDRYSEIEYSLLELAENKWN